MRQDTVFRLALLANLSALSIILYYTIRIPLPFIFPGFLEIQFSNVPAIIAGFMTGPIGGAVVVVVRTLAKMPGSHTMNVGEFADMIIGIPTVVISAVIYMKHRTKKGAILASVAGIITWVVVAVIGNYFLFLPFYAELFGVDELLKFLQVIPGVTADNYLWRFALFAALPFNILLASMVYGITFLSYKRLVHLIESVHSRLREL